MNTTLNTNTFTIALTEIAPDFNDATRLELCFVATVTRAYLDTIHDADTVADILDDSPHVVYEFNVASRHDDRLYANFQHDRSGDCFDDYESAIDTFGQPVIDFIDATCRLLNVPFYPTR